MTRIQISGYKIYILKDLQIRIKMFFFGKLLSIQVSLLLESQTITTTPVKVLHVGFEVLRLFRVAAYSGIHHCLGGVVLSDGSFL